MGLPFAGRATGWMTLGGDRAIGHRGEIEGVSCSAALG